MIRYIHGSADSTDLDTVYVFEEMPSFPQCQLFCQSSTSENKNIIVICDGIVVDCFKGLPDEVNNALYTTYPLHEKEYPLLVNRTVPRDVFRKDITVTRKLLSSLTRTNLRSVIKKALRENWQYRLSALRSLELSEIRFVQSDDCFPLELRKLFAFQLGQAIGLHQGKELYTKADISAAFPNLHPYLYREDVPISNLQTALSDYCEILEAEKTIDSPDGLTRVISSGNIYNIHRELRIKPETGYRLS